MRKLLLATSTGVLIAFSVYVAVQMSAGEEHAEDRLHPSNPLIDSQRASLSLCVAGAGGYASKTKDVSRVRTALDSVLVEHKDAPREYADRSLTAGCPPARVPIGDPVSHVGAYAKPVDEPSSHFIFVYFLLEDVYLDTFPLQEAYSLGSAELMCSGDECERVTIGLYIPANADQRAIEQALLEPLRLTPRG